MSDIALLYEDEGLLAVNKPAGLRTIADGYDPSLPHLSALLQARLGRLYTLHRLDKDTSGVILFARTPEAHRQLNLQFEQRAVAKEYHALALGQPNWQQTEADLPLRINGDRRHRTIIDPSGGRPARTSLRLLAYCPAYTISLIAAQPHSGYTHQIRAHLAALGLPIYADPLYKSRAPLRQPDQPQPNLPIQRTALHARQITFVHPTHGEAITIIAPYPPDFEAALQFCGFSSFLPQG